MKNNEGMVHLPRRWRGTLHSCISLWCEWRTSIFEWLHFYICKSVTFNSVTLIWMLRWIFRVRAPRYQIIPPETDLNSPPLLPDIYKKVLPIVAARTGRGTIIWVVWTIWMCLISLNLYFFLLVFSFQF